MKLEHSYHSFTDGHWLKGNLHTDSTRSDGSHDSQDVIRTYAESGYDFLTSADDYAALDNCGLTLIPGNEVTDDRIRAETSNAQRIVALRDTARRIAVVDEPVIELEIPGDASYIRFECWGPGEPFAWTPALLGGIRLVQRDI